MPDAELTRAILVEGAIGGAIMSALAFLLSRFVREILGRALLVILLFVAAGAYVGFATVGAPGSVWLLVEVAHVIAFGAFALLGWSRSPYWVAAGWALHPLWDGWHLVGPGSGFTPPFYAIACVSFDWVVALFIVGLYRFGLVRENS